MSWVRLDDRILTHPKVLQVRPAERLMYVWSLCWASSHRTDGRITVQGARHIGTQSGIKSWRKSAANLVRAGLWIEVPGEDAGWAIHDYAEYQPTGDQAERLRQVRAEAGRKGGIESGKRRRQAEAIASEQTNPVPSRPVPSESSSSSTSSSFAHEAPVENDEGNERVAREVAAELGRRDATRAQGVKAFARYAQACATSRWHTHRDEILALVAERPELTIRALADLVEHPANAQRLRPCSKCGGRHSGRSCPFAGAQVLDDDGLLAALEADLDGTT